MKRSIRYSAIIFVIFCLSFLILKPTNEESKVNNSRITYKSYEKQDDSKDNNISEVIDNQDGKIKELPVPSGNESLDVRTLPVPNPNGRITITTLN